MLTISRSLIERHQALLASSRSLIERSRKRLNESWAASILAGIKHHNSVPTDRGQDLKPEANEPTIDRETVNELIRLTSKLLSRYGRDIEADNLIVRCVAISEFIIATYSVQPDLTVYRILQHDDEENISQLFVATWHWGLGTPDLRLYRDGPWEKTFRELAAAEMVDLAQHLH